MSEIKTTFIKNKAIELAQNENYYEKIYISFIFSFTKKFNIFYKDNQKIINSWINNNHKKADKIMFLYIFIKTVIFTSNNKPIIDYSRIETFAKFKNEKQKKEAMDTLAEMEDELKSLSNNVLSSSEFRNLYFLAQTMLSFIKYKEERTEMIYFNLKQLGIKTETEPLENIYLDLTKKNNEKFTNSISL